MHATTSTISRTAGTGLLVYGVGTAFAFALSGSPGGDYDSAMVAHYIRSGHWAAAFVIWYAGALCALGLLVAGTALRRLGGQVGELLWGLAIAGTAVSVVGAFVSGGVDVAMAEGRVAVPAGVPPTVVYTLTEIGNLLAVCAPAFFVGVAALLLAARASMPRWLQIFTVLAGVCGILAPLFFTYGVFVLWTAVAGITWIVTGDRLGRAVTQPALQESLV